MNTGPFVVGDRVFNTGNKNRKTLGIVIKVIDADWCQILWSNGEGYAYVGNCRRDGSVGYASLNGHDEDRLVRVKLSVHIPAEAREN